METAVDRDTVGETLHYWCYNPDCPYQAPFAKLYINFVQVDVKTLTPDTYQIVLPFDGYFYVIKSSQHKSFTSISKYVITHQREGSLELSCKNFIGYNLDKTLYENGLYIKEHLHKLKAFL